VGGYKKMAVFLLGRRIENEVIPPAVEHAERINQANSEDISP
jgi:hypothetical protein